MLLTQHHPLDCWYPDTIEHGSMFDNSTDYATDEPVYYYCKEGYTMHSNSSEGEAVCLNGTRDIPECVKDSELHPPILIFIRFLYVFYTSTQFLTEDMFWKRVQDWH